MIRKWTYYAAAYAGIIAAAVLIMLIGTAGAVGVADNRKAPPAIGISDNKPVKPACR